MAVPRLLLVAAATALFVGVLTAADVPRVIELVGAVGIGGLALVLVPQAVALAVEIQGWKLAVSVIGTRVRFWPLGRVRVATEALAQSLPLGVLVSETVKPLLLTRHCGLTTNESVAAMVARKYLLLLSQGAYVLVVATLGFPVLHGVSPGVIGGVGLEWFPFVIGGCLLAASVATAVWLRKSPVASFAFSALARLPFARLSTWLASHERRFRETDQTVSRFFLASPLSHLKPAGFFMLGWFVESCETYLILKVLGANVGLVEVMSLEILITLIRHVVFMIPAGLGVQDLGYVAGFVALGLPEASSLGAAFVLLKRSKELVWIAIGYGLLAADTASPKRRPMAAGVGPL